MPYRVLILLLNLTIGATLALGGWRMLNAALAAGLAG